MSKKLLVLFVFVVLAALVAGCAQQDVNAGVVTPTLVFQKATPGEPKPIATLTVPPEPLNSQLSFEELQYLDLKGQTVENAMKAIYGPNWYSPLREANGVWSTLDLEKNGFISVYYDPSGAMNIAIFRSGNAFRYGTQIPNLEIKLGQIFHGPSCKLNTPEIKMGVIQIFEYRPFKGDEYIRYLKFDVSQVWKKNFWNWTTVSEKTEEWFLIKNGELMYIGEQMPTSP